MYTTFGCEFGVSFLFLCVACAGAPFVSHHESTKARAAEDDAAAAAIPAAAVTNCNMDSITAMVR